MNMELIKNLKITAKNDYLKELNELTVPELHDVLSKFIMGKIANNWIKSKQKHNLNKRAFYFSAEFLMGRLIHNNMFALQIYNELKDCLEIFGIDINSMEEIEDMALGNGGLGRLAACFLDSAATHNIPLDGYGIRYKYGLFKQKFENGFQVESADNWQKFGDPWSVRVDKDSVYVKFADMAVKAVPYDTPIIGYGTDNINTLRLWQSEAINEFNFQLFNDQLYDEASIEQNRAQDISKVLYPNDTTIAGQTLRLRQEYFFCSASLQDILKKFKKINGTDFTKFPKFCAIQLNDTHPVVSIAELIRLLNIEGLNFETAFNIAQQVFSYTNHTVMSEALETWDISLFSSLLPEVYEIIVDINERLIREISSRNIKSNLKNMLIISDSRIHMARLAVYVCHCTNGVAKIHTEILKNNVLKDWYELYPERFQNKTNGITQRRWLALCNPELSAFITNLISDSWITDLSNLEKLKEFCENPSVIADFNSIKLKKKQQLSDYILKREKEYINPSFIFDVQIKRLHEYKRQLLNAFSIMEIYFRIKEGTLTNFSPTVFIFGAKAAPGYKRAKTIIKYINEIKNLINNDPDVNDKIKVIFITNYNVSYAEKIIPATDISEQISTAGTEASGTGNMKLMLNGAVTLGTFDGANIEIVESAGTENNYIFGATVDEIKSISNNYSPKEIYQNDPQIKRVLDTLIDGTFNCGPDLDKADFKELFDSILNGASWHKADMYYLLHDFHSYVDAKIKANLDTKNKFDFGSKCLKNIASAGIFSSDRTIKQYATDIWGL